MWCRYSLYPDTWDGADIPEVTVPSNLNSYMIKRLRSLELVKPPTTFERSF